jgi:integrase
MAWIIRKRRNRKPQVGYREPGSRVTRYVTVPDMATARRVKTEVEHRMIEGAVGGGVVPKRKTFGEWRDEWLPIRTKRVAPTTLRRDRGLLRTYFAELDDRLISSITPEELQSIVDAVMDKRSRATAKRLEAVGSKLFGDAVKKGYIRESLFEKIDPIPQPEGRTRDWSVEDFCTLLSALPQQYRAFTFTDALTGLRFAEIRGLEWSAVDLDANKIHVRKGLPAGTRKESLKTEASQRSVDMLPAVKSVLMDLPQRGRLVFPGARGGPLNHTAFSKTWRRVAKNAKLEGLRFHDCRHLFGSLLLAFGEPVHYVSAQMGHSAVSVTMNVYAHVLKEGRKLDQEATIRKLLDAMACPVLVPPKAKKWASAQTPR